MKEFIYLCYPSYGYFTRYTFLFVLHVFMWFYTSCQVIPKQIMKRCVTVCVHVCACVERVCILPIHSYTHSMILWYRCVISMATGKVTIPARHMSGKISLIYGMHQIGGSNGPWRKKTKKSGMQSNGREMKQYELVSIVLFLPLFLCFKFYMHIAISIICEEER